MKRILAVLLVCLLLTGCTAVIYEPPVSDPDLTGGETLTVHFIDVGQADCILLECAEQYMLIDGGNREDGQLVVSYLQQQGVEELEMVVCTHAHEDNAAALPSVLAVSPSARALFPTPTYCSTVFYNFPY